MNAIADPGTDKCEKTPTTWKTKFYFAGVENTGTRFNFESVAKATSANGTVRFVTLPAASGWGPQMDAWTAAFAAAYPEACEVAKRWWEWRPAFLPNTGAGSIPPADFPFPAAFGQYVQLTFCPDSLGFQPVSVELQTRNGAPFVRQQVMGTGESDIEYITRCISCDPDCEDEPPKCGIPAADNFPVATAALCSTDTFDLCSRVIVDGEPVDTPIVGFLTTCDGERGPLELFEIDEDGVLEEFTPPAGATILTANKEPFVVPEPEPDILGKLCEIRDLLACDCTELYVSKPTLLDGEGNDTGTIVQFPHTSPPGELADFVHVIGLDDPDGCLAAADPNTIICVREIWTRHDLVTGNNGTTGSNSVVGAGATPATGATVKGVSPTNTANQPTTANNAGIGASSGNLDVATRWVDWGIPLGELLAYVDVQTSAFGWLSDPGTETVANVKFKLLTDMTQFGCKENC